MVETYTDLIFETAIELSVEGFETLEHFRNVPGERQPWQAIEPGFIWGEAWGSAWFRSHVRIEESLANRALYLRAQTNGVETLLWVDGKPKGIFTHSVDAASLGGHHTLFLCTPQAAGTEIALALESYAGHPIPGTQPLQGHPSQAENVFRRTYRSLQVMTRREEVKDFVFDLLTLCQLWERLPEQSFRRGAIARGLEAVFTCVPQAPQDCCEDEWKTQVIAARGIMAPLLSAHSGSSAPLAGIVGHSHMDTAWLWPIDETIRKCARTYANALSLMDQYPEYLFVQSTPLYAEWMRVHYPVIFEGIKRRVAEGRWEPNGGMWVECDCNLTSGESMIRQFIKGQAFTREHFNYRADTFWLPDTFGYSAAIPQIMQGCGIRYFLTTKLTWNEYNTFPYDTFWWHGLDGSQVLTHFNDIHCWPDPATLINKIEGGGPKDFRSVENYVLHKDVNDRRLISYGFGDGGGGPQFEMLEMARRCADLEGCPKAEHTTVSKFMEDLKASSHNIPSYHGELYFEGHRGSLTQMAGIKRGNRKAELGLRDAEFFSVVSALNDVEPLRGDIVSLYETLLINQFHDILPGTSIPEVHTRALKELDEVVQKTNELCGELIGHAHESKVMVWNSLSWPRSGILSLPVPGKDLVPAEASIVSQRVTTLDGSSRLLVRGMELPPLAGKCLALVPGQPRTSSPFIWNGHRLETPLLRVEFDGAGFIESLWDVARRRELRGKGFPLNTLLCGEDVPESWDNWNIDADQQKKLKPQNSLLSREVVADGALQFRLRSIYRIGERSTLRQDMVFYADSLRIDFETEVDWQERHQLLKVTFPLNLSVSSARQEVQFGHIVRSTLRRNSHEQAMFEVCNHKWTDLSENRYGVALLNDCKYGLSVEQSELRLTLLKSGCRPDPRGDNGLHRFTYSLVPHEGGFHTETVVRPAYELNIPLRTGRELPYGQESLFEVDASNVIVEAIKPAEDGEGCIIRLYEAEQASGPCTLRFPRVPARVIRTNMLEEPIEDLPLQENQISLELRAFEIVTLRLIWQNPDCIS